MILYVSNEPEGRIDRSLITFKEIVSKFPKTDKNNIKGIGIEYHGQPLVIAPSHKLFSFGVRKSRFDEKKYSMSLVMKDDEPIVDAIEVIERECKNHVLDLADRPILEKPLKIGKDNLAGGTGGTGRSKILNVKITPDSRFYDVDRNRIDYTNLTSSCDICSSLRIDSMYIVDRKAYIQFKIDEAIVIPRKKTETEKLTLDLSRIDLNN
jgi:hypothetical protein